MIDLEQMIARIVDERIALALAKVNAVAPYTSTNLPPDCPSRRAFATACKRIPSACLQGKCWVVARADWDAHRSRPRRTGRDIDALISAAGYRPTTKRLVRAGGS